MTVYMHGDFGGGVAEFAYDKIINKIASNGYCVVAPKSCPVDNFCMNGETSYLEVLKTLVYVEQNQQELS